MGDSPLFGEDGWEGEREGDKCDGEGVRAGDTEGEDILLLGEME